MESKRDFGNWDGDRALALSSGVNLIDACRAHEEEPVVNVAAVRFALRLLEQTIVDLDTVHPGELDKYKALCARIDTMAVVKASPEELAALGADMKVTEEPWKTN